MFALCSACATILIFRYVVTLPVCRVCRALTCCEVSGLFRFKKKTRGLHRPCFCAFSRQVPHAFVNSPSRRPCPRDLYVADEELPASAEAGVRVRQGCGVPLPPHHGHVHHRRPQALHRGRGPRRRHRRSDFLQVPGGCCVSVCRVRREEDAYRDRQGKKRLKREGV